MIVISYEGRTSIVYQWKPNQVCKVPWPNAPEPLEEEFDMAILNEKKILMKLPRHPGIIEYHGPCKIEGMKDGLLFKEANCGDLQSYIDKKGDAIPHAVRERWILQIVKAVSHLHQENVVHMDISTKNILLHRDDQNIDAILADFGGSRCVDLGLPGISVPRAPYRDPHLTEFDSSKVDIFSLGVTIYIIATGHYPFHERPAPEGEEMWNYGVWVQTLYKEGKFPSLVGVPFGDIISGCCCTRQFENATDVADAIETYCRNTALSGLSILVRGRSNRPTTHLAEYYSTVDLKYMAECQYTKDQDFEMINYRAFQASEENRLMSWKADQSGKGKVSVGKRDMKSTRTDKDENELLLPAGWSVTVDSMNFKLAKQ